MKLFLFFIFISLPLVAQVEYSHGVVPPGEYPGFYIDAANYKGDMPGKTRLDVYLQIPYENLQFVKNKNQYRAKYSLTVTIYDEDKENVIVEKIWNGKIFAKSYEEASSENNYKFIFKSFDLEPNNYKLSAVLYDKDSKKDYSVIANLEVRDFNKPLKISDILFISSEIDSQLVLNIANTISSVDSTLFFYYEIYSNTNKIVNLEYVIENPEGDKNLIQKESIKIDAGVNQIKKKLNNFNTSLGKYKLIVQIVNNDGEIVTGISKTFISKIDGFPASITDLDEAIKQMEYIASGDEIDDMLETKNFDEKLEKFKAFWKKKDPSPNTPQNEVLREYYRRVAYANKHFEHYYVGWKTDMGMIYIILGPPDNVDRHPFEYDSKPYEIWYYYNINQTLYFIDETGFGDYRLLNRNYGDWYKYRQY